MKHPILLWVLLALAVSGIFMMALTYGVASYLAYTRTLQRRSKEQWSREMPKDLCPEALQMYEAGARWSEENAMYKQDVSIVRDGLHLYGEYYDLGASRCAVILSGRTESLKYGYYFAIPYAKNGCNVLVLDPRGHGLSDGEFNTVGFEESKDITAWVKYMHSVYKIPSFIFHGICIGAAGGVLSLTSEDAPPCVEGIVTEGMFPNFGESIKNHLREKRKPIFIFYDLMNAWMKHFTGHSMKKGPIDVIHRLQTPLLMLHSREDRYSTPEYAQKLYDLGGMKEKRLVWFPHGKHSMLRITDTERYDRAIAEFIDFLNKQNNN